MAAFIRSLFGGAASVKDTMRAIDDACVGTGFSCKTISWEDAQRAAVNGNVSCWGPNVSDVRLYEKSGALLYTVRSENWNERLGYTTSDKVAVVKAGDATTPPTSMTLRDFLTQFGANANYAGIESTRNLSDETLDQSVSMRFQTVFLPASSDSTTKRATSEFCTEVYNYNTRDGSDPRNVLLLCTPQAVSVQQDGKGAQKLFFHAVDPTDKTVHRYWLEAEESSHKVGAAQNETKEEAEDAAKRGKATATFIGTEAMGTRFNVQMLVQVPLKQKQRATIRSYNAYTLSTASMSDESEGCDEVFTDCCAMPMAYACCAMSDSSTSYSANNVSLERAAQRKSVPKGISSAARVSRGSEYDVWPGVYRSDPERDPAQHITITVTLYNMVVGGVPTAEDVKAAIADLDSLYKACDSSSTLATSTTPLPELTVGTMLDITTKVTQQPYTPQPTPAASYAGATAFPRSSASSTIAGC